ncbi:hypothetical protein Thiowin_02893 [Thiorhodovibrio winogradskyi]|uniref:Uncharacterized protein n=1 Tax=Thiorhodovibrio winogradskyi TaxID=77007 RepID=A0ABZ0SCL4_9GAMM
MGMLILILFCVAAGAFIGWNVPQPEAARKLQDQVLKLLGQSKTDNRDSDNQ